MKKLPKNYLENETKRIEALSNAGLFLETIHLAGGDNFDGCFTKEGEVTFLLLLKELDTRLVKMNFIGDSVFKDEYEGHECLKK